MYICCHLKDKVFQCILCLMTFKGNLETLQLIHTCKSGFLLLNLNVATEQNSKVLHFGVTFSSCRYQKNILAL